jgi:hypothetical protein
VLLVLLTFGGTGVRAEVHEALSAETETCISHEATDARRQSTHSKRVRDRHAREVKGLVAKAQSQRHEPRRLVDDDAPLCDFFPTASASRAPPVSA